MEVTTQKHVNSGAHLCHWCSWKASWGNSASWPRLSFPRLGLEGLHDQDHDHLLGEAGHLPQIQVCKVPPPQQGPVCKFLVVPLREVWSLASRSGPVGWSPTGGATACQGACSSCPGECPGPRVPSPHTERTGHCRPPSGDHSSQHKRLSLVVTFHANSHFFTMVTSHHVYWRSSTPWLLIWNFFNWPSTFLTEIFVNYYSRNKSTFPKFRAEPELVESYVLYLAFFCQDKTGVYTFKVYTTCVS